MADNNRDQSGNTPANENENLGRKQFTDQQQKTSDQPEENSQDGGSWNNYRTREMGSNDESNSNKSSEEDTSTQGNP